MLGAHELQIFLAAAEEENFSVAARKLHLSQPAISFQVQSLEQQFKVKLFDRVGKRITLTEAGHDLIPLAREMVNLSARIEETMCLEQGMVKGQIQIACSTSPGKYILPHLIGAFRKLYPEAQFSVQVMNRAQVEEKLLTQQVHIGVLSAASQYKELECWRVFDDELVLIVGATHPWASRAVIMPNELKEVDWILREGGAATRQLIVSTLAEHGLTPEDLRVAMELGSVEAVEEAVEAGLGVSIVSRVVVRRALEMERIKVVRIEGVSVRRDILLARNRTRACTCTPLRFREFIESAQGQQVISTIV